ncbi:MAG: hypothetical protein E8D49_15480 [Nitrospira sp.]|nr:MAG: hypothetical protein E8D49_15480 [Nitrospira sp.]
MPRSIWAEFITQEGPIDPPLRDYSRQEGLVKRAVVLELQKQLEEIERARAPGCTSVRGRYIVTAKNAMVKGVFVKFGLKLVEESDGSSVWEYDLTVQQPIKNEFNEVV